MRYEQQIPVPELEELSEHFGKWIPWDDDVDKDHVTKNRNLRKLIARLNVDNRQATPLTLVVLKGYGRAIGYEVDFAPHDVIEIFPAQDFPKFHDDISETVIHMLTHFTRYTPSNARAVHTVYTPIINAEAGKMLLKLASSYPEPVTYDDLSSVAYYEFEDSDRIRRHINTKMNTLNHEISAFMSKYSDLGLTPIKVYKEHNGFRLSKVQPMSERKRR